jgi:hypothetical protein
MMPRQLGLAAPARNRRTKKRAADHGSPPVCLSSKQGRKLPCGNDLTYAATR